MPAAARSPRSLRRRLQSYELSLEVERDAVVPEHVQTEEAPHLRTDDTQHAKVRRADGQIAGNGRADPQRVDRYEPYRSRPAKSRGDAAHGSALGQLPRSGKCGVDTGHRRPGVEEQVDWAVAVDVGGDRERGTPRACPSEAHFSAGR